MAAQMEEEGPPPLPASPPPFANHHLDGGQSPLVANREKFRSLQKMVSALLSPPPQTTDGVSAPPPKRPEIEANAEQSPGPKLVHPTHGRPKRPLVRPPSKGFLKLSGTDLRIALGPTTTTSTSTTTTTTTITGHELAPQLEEDDSLLPPPTPSAPPPPLPTSDLPPPATTTTEEVDGAADVPTLASPQLADTPPQLHSTPIPTASDSATKRRAVTYGANTLKLSSTLNEQSEASQNTARSPPAGTSLFSSSSYAPSPISPTPAEPSLVASTSGHNDSAIDLAGKGSGRTKRSAASATFSDKLKKIREIREKRIAGNATRESPSEVPISKQPPPQFILGSPDTAQLSPPSNPEGTKQVPSLTTEPNVVKTSMPNNIGSTAVSPSPSASLSSVRLWQRKEYRLQKTQMVTPPPMENLLPNNLSSPKLLSVSPLPSVLQLHGSNHVSNSPVFGQTELWLPSSNTPVTSLSTAVPSSQPPVESSTSLLPLHGIFLPHLASPSIKLPTTSNEEPPSSPPPDLPSSLPPEPPSSPPPQLPTSPFSDLLNTSASYGLPPSSANQSDMVPEHSATAGAVSAQQTSGENAPSGVEDSVVLRRAQQQGLKEGSQKHRWSSTVKRLSLAETREFLSASRLPSAPLKRWTALDMEHSENASSENGPLAKETSPKGENIDSPYVTKANKRSRTGALHHLLDELNTSASASNIIFNREPDVASTSNVSLDKVVPPSFHILTEDALQSSPPPDFGLPPSPSPQHSPSPHHSPSPQHPPPQHPPSPPPPQHPPSPPPPQHPPSPPPPQHPPPSPPQHPPSPLPPQHPPSPLPPQHPPSPPPPQHPPSPPPPQHPPSPPPSQHPPSPPPPQQSLSKQPSFPLLQQDPLQKSASSLPSPPLSPPPSPPLPPQEPPSPPSPSPSPSREPSSSPPQNISTTAEDSKQESSGRRRTVKSMISTSSLHRQELESDLDPMSTTLDALMVMRDNQDKQIDSNLAEMKRQQMLTKSLLEGDDPLIFTAEIIPTSLSEKPQEWSTMSVCRWMETAGFGSYKDMFKEANVTGAILVDLDEEALVELGVQSPKVRSKMLSIIGGLDSCTKEEMGEQGLLPLLSPPDDCDYDGLHAEPATPPNTTPSKTDPLLVQHPVVQGLDKGHGVGKGLGANVEPNMEAHGRHTSNAEQLKETPRSGIHASPLGEERGIVRLFMDTVQSNIYYKAFTATVTTTAADLITKAISKADLIEDPRTFYIQQTVLPACTDHYATNKILGPLECPLAMQIEWSSYDGFRFDLKRNETAKQLLVDVTLMTGHVEDSSVSLYLSQDTPCTDVLALMKARLRDKRRSCALVEVNLDTGVERALNPSECPMATRSSWGSSTRHVMKLVPREAASSQEALRERTNTSSSSHHHHHRRPSSHLEKLQAQLSELEQEKETLARNLCSAKVKLQRMESTEVDVSSLNDAHQALTKMVKSQQESHRREVQELQAQVEGLTLANRQLKELQLVTSTSPQGQTLGEIQKRYNQEMASLKERLCAMEKTLQALEIRSKQSEEELAGKTREVEQLTALLSSSKQQVESLEHDLGSRDSALRLANLKLKETESMQNGLSEGDNSVKVNTLLATISSLEMNLDTTKAECQRQTSELQASKTELGHLKLHLADKVKESSEIQTGSKKGQSLFARLSARSPQVIITLELEPTDQGLGIKVANAPPEVGGCIVKGTAPYCQTDQLRHGDKFLEVNEVDVSTLNHNELGDILQKSSRTVVRLVVGRLVPMEILAQPRASTSADPKWSSLQRNMSPLKVSQETTELIEKCRRLQADLVELASSKKTVEAEVKQLHVTIQTLSSQLSDAEASLSKDKLYLDRLLTVVVEQAPHLLSMMDEGSLESDYPGDSDDNSWC